MLYNQGLSGVLFNLVLFDHRKLIKIKLIWNWKIKVMCEDRKFDISNFARTMSRDNNDLNRISSKFFL